MIFKFFNERKVIVYVFLTFGLVVNEKCMLWEERRKRKKSQVDLPPISNALLLLPWEQKFLAYPSN